jgi:hypothetical protein
MPTNIKRLVLSLFLSFLFPPFITFGTYYDICPFFVEMSARYGRSLANIPNTLIFRKMCILKKSIQSRQRTGHLLVAFTTCCDMDEYGAVWRMSFSPANENLHNAVPWYRYIFELPILETLFKLAQFVAVAYQEPTDSLYFDWPGSKPK